MELTLPAHSAPRAGGNDYRTLHERLSPNWPTVIALSLASFFAACGRKDAEDVGVTGPTPITETLDQEFFDGRTFEVRDASGVLHRFEISGDEISQLMRQDSRSSIPTDAPAPFYREVVQAPGQAVASLAANLTRGVRSKERKAQILLDWVSANIRHEEPTPEAASGHFRLPVETLYQRRGDGKELAALYAALCHAAGIDAAILDFGSHLAVGVSGRFDGAYFEYRGRNYFVAETSQRVEGGAFSYSRIGEMRRTHENAGAQLYPMVRDYTLRAKDVGGRTHSFTINAKDYLRYSELRADRDGWSSNRQRYLYDEYLTPQDPVIRQIASTLTAGAKSSEEKAQHLLNFVQENIRYRFDEKSLGADDYWKYPLETLFDGVGDCEDTSLLFASLCRAAGVDVAIFHMPGHLAAGVSGDFRGWSVELHGKRYYFAETATESRESIGYMNQKYSDAEIQVYVAP